MTYIRAMQSLKTWMTQHNVTQTKLADELGVEQPTVWGWLNVGSVPRTSTLLKLAQFTGLSIDELLVGSRKKERRKSH